MFIFTDLAFVSWIRKLMKLLDMNFPQLSACIQDAALEVFARPDHRRNMWTFDDGEHSEGWGKNNPIQVFRVQSVHLTLS